MIDVYVSDLRTGDDLVRLPVLTGGFEDRRNSAERANATVTLRDANTRRLDLRSTLANGKSILSFFEGDVCLGGVAVQEHDYDRDARRLTFEGEGVWSVLRRRFVMPAAAETVPLLIQDGDSAGEPNPAVRTTITQKSWPVHVRTLLEQSMARLGGELPLNLSELTGTGAHDGSYEASSFITLGDALDDLVSLDDGPEIDFVCRRRSDNEGIEFLVRVGDDAQLQIRSDTVHEFDFSAKRPTVRGLRVRSSAESLRSETWATGGRQKSIALYARAFDQVLLNNGFPRYESISSANSTVERQSTLNSYARRNIRDGSRLTEWWTFETRMDAAPVVGTWAKGDLVDVIIGDDDPYIQPGKYRRRIASYSFDVKRSGWVKITTDEVLA